MSSSPNKLDIHPKILIEKASPKLKIAFLGIIIITILIVTLGRSKRNNEIIEQAPQEIKVESEKSFAPVTKSTGLLTPPKKEEPKKEVKVKVEEKLPEIKISRVPEPSEKVKRFLQLREQRYLEALNAPSLAYQNKQQANNTANQVTTSTVNYQKPIQQQALSTGLSNNEYDVSADIDKEKFFERAKPDNQWINENIRTAGQKYEIKTGNVIPAVLITGINSDLPGNIIAQVSQDIFDTASGNYLLIPRGAKLFGTYDSRIIMGQRRVLVAWNRIIFPDGSTITIPSIPGADLAGFSGFEQHVNNHYFRIFGSSVLMALITAGTAYAVDQNSTSENENSLQSQLNSSLAQQLGQVTSSLLQKNLNIKPTLEIEPGYQFNVVLTKDLIFGGEYREWQ